MNACVESVCPDPMISNPLEPAVRRSAPWVPEGAATREWFGKVWTGVTGARQARRAAVVHVHVDSFYAAVEQAMNPRLRGKAVLVVGGGAVASASPEAQNRGAGALMSVRDALKTCPNAIIVPGDYARYAEHSARVRQVLETYATSAETTACGSFYLSFFDTTFPCSGFQEKLQRMQAEILGQTGLSASAGAGVSRMVAALAAREHRPCGLRIVEPGAERQFLRPFAVERLRGIGQKHLAALREGGITTIGELQQIPKPVLSAAFGTAIGRRIWELARGLEPSHLWLSSLREKLGTAGSAIPA